VYEPEGIYFFVYTFVFQRKYRVSDPNQVTYMSDLRKCDKEDFSDDDDQPLHIDEAFKAIKCKWCPTWIGSQAAKV